MSKVILILCYGLIYWLFRRDVASRKAGSSALWIPSVWIAIHGSRPVAYWFGGTVGAGGAEGHPITTVSYLLFLVAALVVLKKRGVNWGSVAIQNKALFAIYGYLLLTSVWSELPFVSIKRLIKNFEMVMVGLILLTEVNPAETIRTIYVRVSYILFPLSVVFIKFIPQIGRRSTRAGENMFTGITDDKNSLGEIVFVFGIFLLWDLVEIWRAPERKNRKEKIAIRVGMLLSGVWLLEMCESRTSLLCLLLGAITFWGCGRLIKMRNGKSVLIACLAVVICVALVDKTVGISDVVIRALGRDPSLTGRTNIWQLVLDQQTHQAFGNGYYTFWSGSKGMAVIEEFAQINSAHNGYLELYLDGGLVAGGFLAVFLLTTGSRVISRLFEGHLFGRIGLIFWILAIIYNFSESSFFRNDVLWFTLVMVSLARPDVRRQLAIGRKCLQPVSV